MLLLHSITKVSWKRLLKETCVNVEGTILFNIAMTSHFPCFIILVYMKEFLMVSLRDVMAPLFRIYKPEAYKKGVTLGCGATEASSITV